MKRLKFFGKNKKIITDVLIFLAVTILLCVISAAVLNVSIILETKDRIYDTGSLDDISGKYDCILILGAGVRPDGTPSPMLEDRLKVGKMAYDSGKASLIIVSGDSHKSGYDEVLTMKKYLADNGIPDANIVCDGYGLSTYDSIYRLYMLYGCKKVIIVTQSYHLNRAMYIAEKLGLDACGLSADLRGYKKQFIYSLREGVARVKDFFFTLDTRLPEYTDIWAES